jgi:hypothetical protein
MATAVQIEVILDDSGVVNGVQRIRQGVKNVADDGNKAFTRLSSNVGKSRESVMFLNEALGVHIPRGIARMLSDLPGIASGFKTAFAVTSIILAAKAIADLVNNFDDLNNTITRYVLYLRQFWQEVTTWGHSSIKEMANVAKEQKLIEPLMDQVRQFANAARTAGKQGVDAIISEFENREADIKRTAGKILQDAATTFGGGDATVGISDPRYQETVALVARQTSEAIVQAKNIENEQLAKLRRDDLRDIQKKQDEANNVILTGMAAQVGAEKAALDQIESERAAHTSSWATGEVAAVRAKTTAEIEKQGREWKEQIDQLANESFKQGTAGIAVIEIETENKIAKLRQDFIKQWGETFVDDPGNPDNVRRWQAWFNAERDYTNALVGLRTSAAQRVKQAEAAIEGETANAEQGARVANLPVWMQGIIGSETQRDAALREIDKWEAEMLNGLSQGSDEYVFIEQEGQRRRIAAWQQANGEIVRQMEQVRDQLAGELESVFDDIFNGNIGKRILKMIEDFFFRIVASWIMAMNGMKGASGNMFGSSILGSLFGGLFGGGGATQWVTAGAGTIPLFGSSSSSSSLFGGGSNQQQWVTAGAGAIPLFGGLSGGGGTAGVASAQMANTAFGGVFANGLAKLFPNGLSIGGLKLTGAQLGMMGGMIGLESILGAYGSGNPIMGGIGGGIGGLMMGAAMGGPITMAIGGIIGAIAGIFGGIFGRNKRRHQAEGIVYGTYLPAIKQIEDDFAAHQIEYQAALDQLDQLEQQAKQQLHQLGDQGDSVFNAYIPGHIADAKKQMLLWQNDRTARGAVDFGAPLFDAGGYVGDGSHTVGILRNDEFVMNPMATALNRPLLESLNAGGKSSGDTFIFNTLDAKTMSSWLNNGGARLIRNAVRRAEVSYSGQGLV